MIKQADLTCPICRAVITIVMDDNPVVLITKEEWDAFQKNKKEYTGKFRVRGNAFFVGSNSKKAKEIAKMACSELEQRYLERRGSEMCMSKQKKVEEKDGRLFVSYKVGRKTHEMEMPLYEIPEDMKDMEDLELATHYPELYWIRYYLRIQRADCELGLMSKNN